MLARSAGLCRAPSRVLVDGKLEFTPGQHAILREGTESRAIPAHRIVAIPGGWDITAPDGGRLLLAAGPGQVPEPPQGTWPFNVAVLDLLAGPAQLGLLRSAGLLLGDSTVTALCTDHRVTSEPEMARRCELWGVQPGRDGQLVSVRAGAGAPGPARSGQARPHRTLIIGGARSGKSTEAELRLAAEPQVTYVAAGPWAAAVRDGDEELGQDAWTGQDGEPDTEWAERVARHRARRPFWWRTAESLDVAGLLREETGAVLIDGIGTWLAGIMDEAGMWADRPRSAEIVRHRIDELIEAWRQTRALVVAVTDQVGSGLVPAYHAGRIFRDELGWLNQRIAAESELNLLVVAGRVTTLSGCDESVLITASDRERHETGPGSC